MSNFKLCAMKREKQKVIEKQKSEQKNENTKKKLNEKETKDSQTAKKHSEAPIIAGLAAGISTANHHLKNDDTNINSDNRRSFLGKFLKTSALIGLGSLFAVSSTGCDPDDDCSCESIGNCKCDEVCTCNKVCSCEYV